jgi:hypothetical protein
VGAAKFVSPTARQDVQHNKFKRNQDLSPEKTVPRDTPPGVFS